MLIYSKLSWGWSGLLICPLHCLGLNKKTALKEKRKGFMQKLKGGGTMLLIRRLRG